MTKSDWLGSENKEPYAILKFISSFLPQCGHGDSKLVVIRVVGPFVGAITLTVGVGAGFFAVGSSLDEDSEGSLARFGVDLGTTATIGWGCLTATGALDAGLTWAGLSSSEDDSDDDDSFLRFSGTLD